MSNVQILKSYETFEKMGMTFKEINPILQGEYPNLSTNKLRQLVNARPGANARPRANGPGANARPGANRQSDVCVTCSTSRRTSGSSGEKCTFCMTGNLIPSLTKVTDYPNGNLFVSGVDYEYDDIFKGGLFVSMLDKGTVQRANSEWKINGNYVRILENTNFSKSNFDKLQNGNKIKILYLPTLFKRGPGIQAGSETFGEWEKPDGRVVTGEERKKLNQNTYGNFQKKFNKVKSLFQPNVNNLIIIYNNIIKVIHKFITDKKNVRVFCQQGKDRSTLIVYMYLLAINKDHTIPQVFEMVHSKRPFACLEGYAVVALYKFDELLKNGTLKYLSAEGVPPNRGQSEGPRPGANVRPGANAGTGTIFDTLTVDQITKDHVNKVKRTMVETESIVGSKSNKTVKEIIAEFANQFKNKNNPRELFNTYLKQYGVNIKKLNTPNQAVNAFINIKKKEKEASRMETSGEGNQLKTQIKKRVENFCRSEGRTFNQQKFNSELNSIGASKSDPITIARTIANHMNQPNAGPGANEARPRMNARTNRNNRRNALKQRVINGCTNNQRTFNDATFNRTYNTFKDLMEDEELFSIIKEAMSAYGGGQKEYIKLQSGGKRLVRYGKRGGRYYMKGGNKVYIK